MTAFTRFTLLLLSALALSSGAMAATPPSSGFAPLRGTIEQVSDTQLQLIDRKGQKISVVLNDQTVVLSVSKGTLDDIKPDSFIGTAAAPQPDGTLKALEVHVFAASLRGSGEGHSAWIKAITGLAVFRAYGDRLGKEAITIPCSLFNG